MRRNECLTPEPLNGLKTKKFDEKFDAVQVCDATMINRIHKCWIQKDTK